MFVDEAEIIIEGGHGGAGKVSFYPPPMKGPDGGNGGKGGDVYIKVVSDLTALRPFTTKRQLIAENGQLGGSNRKFGKDGKDIEIRMPLGTVLTNKQTGEEITLDKVDERILIAKGGLGGRGNFEFKSSRVTTPEYSQPGLAGERKELSVQLKLIADFGLIGLPSSGKSSLLNELTSAKAKIAAYPFTTLEPNLGMFNRKIFADIPGLIDGASAGKGLGIKFLKHIEKVTLLLHCISTESEDVQKDYQVIRKELEKFNPHLLEKKEIILLTKSDLVNEKQLKAQISKLEKLNTQIVPVSIYDWDSIEALKNYLR